MTTYKVLNPSNRCNLKSDNDDRGTFTGYASVFNSNDLVDDTILPGAFKNYEGVVLPMFVNHKHGDVPIGSFKGAEDEHGFFIKGSINLDHKDGATVHSALKRGDVTGLSIGFGMGADDFEEKDDGGRVIKNLNLKETSVVTWPCEPKAQILAVKSFEQMLTIRDLERAIRDEFGLSKSAAVYFLSHVKRVLSGEPTACGSEIKKLTQRLETRYSGENLKSYLEKLEF